MALQHETDIVIKDGEAAVLTKRNDPLINSHNTAQLSTSRANVDMQPIISKCRLSAILQSMQPSVNHVQKH